MDQSHRDLMAAQIAVREATQALQAAERRYHAAVECPAHRLLYALPQSEPVAAAHPDDIHCVAAAYGAAAASLREAYQRIREVLKEQPSAG